MYCFGGSRMFIGWNGQLWRLNPGIEVEPDLPHLNVSDYYSQLVEPELLLTVEEDRHWKDGGYMFFCGMQDLDRTLRMENRINCECLLENVHHLLLRLQRWIKRVMMRERVRLALLMGLHARLGQECLLGELGHDIINGVLMKVGFKADSCCS